MTQTRADRDDGERSFARVFGASPALYAAFREADAKMWRSVDPGILELCRLRMAMILGSESELACRQSEAGERGVDEDKVRRLAQWPTDPVFSAGERACIELAEQYVIDPKGITPSMVEHVTEALSPEGYAKLLSALGLLDGIIRLGIVLQVDDATGPEPGDERAATDMQTAILDLHFAVLDATAVDKSAIEVARMRAARVIDCPICQSVRFAPHGTRLLDEEVVEQIGDDYEHSELSPRDKTVVEYTDLVLRDPSALSEDLRHRMLTYFSSQELVELTAAIAIFLAGAKRGAMYHLSGPRPERAVHEEDPFVAWRRIAATPRGPGRP
jgi:alkylhydroperoxidase family enzyme